MGDKKGIYKICLQMMEKKWKEIKILAYGAHLAFSGLGVNMCILGQVDSLCIILLLLIQ